MDKEKCFREINDTLAKTISQSILKRFASNLGVEIHQGRQISNKHAQHAHDKDQICDEKDEEFSGYDDEASRIEQLTEPEIDKQEKIAEFMKLQAKRDDRGLTKLIKSLTTETEEDIGMHKRQKNGQLRFGDVITINYQKEIFDRTQDQKHPVNTKFQKVNAWKNRKQKNLFEPDYTYLGLLYSDGVTDRGIKMIPKTSAQIQNACNMFKQCLFRIEVQQACEVNKRRKNLIGQKNEQEIKLKQIIKDKGGENNVKPEMIIQIKKDIEKIDDEIIENESQQITEEENNRYSQEYNRGKKLTYGTPIQLYHLFSGKYLTLNLNQMSSEYGSCELELHQQTDHSQFIIEPNEQKTGSAGEVVSFQDYFVIKSMNTSTPFSIHIYEKGGPTLSKQKSFSVNASQLPSPLKAKLFMSYKNAEREKSGIQSGDVIRLRSFEVNGYLSNQALMLDSLLPCLPDFLKNQIRRMHNLQHIELQVGGKQLDSLTKQEKKFREEDSKFKLENINDEYIKQIKTKSHEHLFVESRHDRLKFTNSCWEIQRANPLQGANLILEEIVRFRHVGTGKFLCIDSNGIDLTMSGSSNNLDTLFTLKSDMSNKNKTKFLDEDGDGVADDPNFIAGNSRVLIQAWNSDKYLQIVGDFDKDENVDQEEESAASSDEDLDLKQEDQRDSQVRIAGGEFQKQDKNKMIFYIEEVDTQESIYSYQCACMFDELLEFYCFLNQFGVTLDDHDDTQENFYLKHQKIAGSQKYLKDKVEKIQFILFNIETRIRGSTFNQRTNEKLIKCKEEISDQGILDVLFCITEILYYKSTPPNLLEKTFKENNKDQKQKDELELKSVKVNESLGQQIIRDECCPLLIKIFEIILMLVDDHKNNSEQSSKYFGILFQQFRAQESFKKLQKIYPSFKLQYNPDDLIKLIGQIFINVQRDCTFVIPDRNLYVLMDQQSNSNKSKRLQAQLSKMSTQKFKKSQTVRCNQIEVFDTAMMGSFQPLEKAINPKLMLQWTQLLQPVKYIDDENTNLINQIMYIQILSNFCIDRSGKGVYPYQKFLTELILEDKSKFFLKFGTAKVEGALRPYVYFTRPKNCSRENFLVDNPMLQQIHDTGYMTQHNNQKAQYDLIFDVNSLTKKYYFNDDIKGNGIKLYVEYICSIINLYATMCLGSNSHTIDLLNEVGLSESHISLILHKDTKELIVHEKFKTSYCYLARVMFIENDYIVNCIENKNRCYVWDRVKKRVENKDQGFSQKDFDDLVVNDEYAGKTKAKVTQLDDPRSPMIILTEDQKLQNKMVISLIKESALWFLLEGPKGTTTFFYHNSRKNFIPASLKIKVQSVLVYLHTIYSIVNKDFLDPIFIEKIQLICQCCLYGSLHRQDPKEEKKINFKRIIDPKKTEAQIPLVIKSNWLYNLMWISKDIVSTNPGIFLEKYNQQIECKALNILDKLSCHKLNTQVISYLTKFRQFQETSLDQDQSQDQTKTFDVEEEFESIFQVQKSQYEQQEIEKARENTHHRMTFHTDTCQHPNCLIKGYLEEFQAEQENLSQTSMKNEIFLNYIFDDKTKQEVRKKALEVLIQEFNQKELLVKELMKTSLIVSNDDYHTHIKFLLKQRHLKQQIQKMLQIEITWTISDATQAAPQEIKEVKSAIMNIINEMGTDIKSFEPVKKRGFQNMVRHIGLLQQLNALMLKLKDKMFYYRDLYQQIIDFFQIVCYNNPIVQGFLLKDLNFFVDMINNRIDTGILISEVIKCNLADSDTQNFIKYLINKIINEGYFKSNLFFLLMKLAGNQQNINQGDTKIERNKNNESSNQQYIMKQIIKNARFRSLIYMQPDFTATKLGIIQSYIKRLDHAREHNKEEDNNYLREKELLDMHLAVIDLLSICAKNSPYGVSQAQKLINVDELLDSILSDAIPYIVKRHYFNLLFEVYLRKVPGIDQKERLLINNLKLQQIFKWVICWDLDQCYNHYSGLVIDYPPEDTLEANKRFRQVNREVQRQCELEFENKFVTKTDQERIEEQQTRQKLQSFVDTTDQFFLDSTDLTEYWRFLYESTEMETSYTGLLSFIELFYQDYTKKDFDDDIEAQRNTLIIKQKLLEMASNIFLIQDTHDDYIKVQSQHILVQINRSVQQMPNFTDFPQLENELEIQESSQASNQVDARMCGDKIIKAISDYIMKENIPIREALGISNVSSLNTMVSKESLKQEIKLICGSGATYDDVVKALDHFHDVSLARKTQEAGPLGYIVEEEVGSNLVDIVDIEVRLRDILAKQGQNADILGGECQGVVVQETIHDQDLSNAINIDLKLFSQRFFEFVRGTKNFSEIHMFVHDLMGQEYTKDRENKIKLIRSLIDGFTGLSGDNDELILISILSLIIQRLIPDQEDSLQASNQTLLYVKKNKKHNDRLKQQLQEWQDIMFEAEVPALMLDFINVNNDPYLSNKALGLLNNILIRTNEVNQEKIIQLLKKDDRFFSVFYYLMMRMQASKNFMLQQIQKSAEQKFIDQNLHKKKKGTINNQNDFQNPSHLLNMKYDLELRYKELTSTWQQEEMYEILKFLNSMCEGCYEPAQMFLGRQQDDEENFKNQKKITSIDLIFEVQRTFIDIVDTMGDYVFSDFRTFKLIPLMMDTMLEFIYGPCITNQVFLGESKKFISVINTLIDQAEMGNYSGIHQQAKAQLVILNSCTTLLLAICDIKDPNKAERTHMIILNEIDIPNLIKKMKDIYIFKIGGDPERQMIYDFNQQCNHYKSQGDEGKSRCLEDEFCEFKYLIPRDINTIQTGFNIYMILTILKNQNPLRKEISIFQRNEGEYNSLVQKQGKLLRHNIYQKYKMSSDKTKNIYERFNKIEVILLDQMIIKSFPELYITYIEKTIEEQKEDPNQVVDYTLKSNIDKAKSCKNKFDQQQILQKLPALMRKNYTDGKNIQQEEETIDHQEETSNRDMTNSMIENERLLSGSQNEIEMSPKGGTLGQESQQFAKKVIPVNAQNEAVNSAVLDKQMDFYQQQIEDQQKVEDEQKLKENVKLFEFYLAGNFYEDNIATIEIQLEEIEGKETYSQLSRATFQCPSFIRHLTQESRDKIPTALNGVSQQEKLEEFCSRIPVLLIEMKWQQRLGRVSYALKIFANQWNLLAWINFCIIVFINIMLIAFYKVEPVEDGRDDQGNQKIVDSYKIPNQQINEIVNDIGLIQSSVAMIVVFAYYIEYRAILKHTIQESKESKNVDLSGYGVSYGSQGYGNRKSGKLNDVKSEQLIQVNPLKGIENKSIVFKIIMILTKEVSMFIKAIYFDSMHNRNILYVFVSVFSNLPGYKIANAVLLLDLIKKVQTLNQVILVITDNAMALGSTLVLFVVLLYFYSFLAFNYVRDDYKQNLNTGSNFYQNHAPVTPGGTYNMDCQTLINCLFSTTSFGMRSGGGVGDALWQRFISDEYYRFRYVFDFSFFMIINIILMNIFFGIIIDSFADKRSNAADIAQEVEQICFICGIGKSKFEIENVSWVEHIYSDHNLHAYYAFIIYVQGKNMSECTGVEKWVKKCLDNDNILFFPVMKCLSINNGEDLD